MELALSARVIIASISFSFLWVDYNIFASGCVLWVGFRRWSLPIRSAINFL